MRVLQVTNTYPPGDISGVGALVIELARGLEARGHEPCVLTRKAAADDPYAVAIAGPKLLFPLLAAVRFLGLSRARPFDLVQVHESDGALVALALRVARALGLAAGEARLVATLQVSYVRERQAVRIVRADGVEVARPTASERVFAYGRAPILAFLGRLTARLADAVVAPSEGTARELEEDYRARAPVVIPNGVAEPAVRGRWEGGAGAVGGHVDAGDGSRAGAAAAGPGQGPEPLRILYAGRLRTRKAVAVLVLAFARVVRELPAARLDVVGAGEQRGALEAQVAALGLGAEVRFLGALPRDDMAPLYTAASVFCLPSTYEGFPVAILEAMSFGLPVVSTRVAGIPEAVEDGVTGFVVEPESATELGAALVRLLGDARLRRAMGEAGMARFRRLYLREQVVGSYLELYARVLAGEAARRAS